MADLGGHGVEGLAQAHDLFAAVNRQLLVVATARHLFGGGGDFTQRLGDGLYVASALGVWAMVLLALTIWIDNSLLGRKLGAVFRI